VDFLTYFDVDYSGKNKSDRAELDKAKEELQKYKPANSSGDSNKEAI